MRKILQPRPPLDSMMLRQLGLTYAARYATTQAKLRDYLRRKIRERGWSESDSPKIDSLIQDFADKGYVDDHAFAQAKKRSLERRGLGQRRIMASLRQAGINDQDMPLAVQGGEDQALVIAFRYAARRRIGPFSPNQGDMKKNRKWFAALLRAGHQPPIAAAVLKTSRDEAESMLHRDISTENL